MILKIANVNVGVVMTKSNTVEHEKVTELSNKMSSFLEKQDVDLNTCLHSTIEVLVGIIDQAEPVDGVSKRDVINHVVSILNKQAEKNGW